MPEEAYGKATVKKTQVHEWQEHFHDGRASVKRRCALRTNDKKHGACAKFYA
jgi:hypothetical protein